MPIITKSLSVPTISENGSPTTLSVTIRRLSYWHVRQAKKAFISEAIAQGKEIGDLQDRIDKAQKKADEERRVRNILEEPATAPDPASMYDKATTLHCGIVTWSYPEEVTVANIDDILGEPESDFIFKEIVAFSERTAAERKDLGALSAPTLESATAPGQES